MEGGKRWQRLNLSEAIKTVKAPRVVTTTSQESHSSLTRQSSGNCQQETASQPAPSLSRSASNSGKFTRLRQAVSPSLGQARGAQEAQEAQEVTNVVLLDSGIASIEDSSSARTMVGAGGGGGCVGGGEGGGAAGLRCNGRLQRANRIEESEPVEPVEPGEPGEPGESGRSWRVQEQQEPLVTTVPGLLQTNSRCNVQTSGWL